MLLSAIGAVFALFLTTTLQAQLHGSNHSQSQLLANQHARSLNHSFIQNSSTSRRQLAIQSTRSASNGNAISQLQAVQIEWSRSLNTISWSGSVDPKHDGTLGCINPAPFGRQSTSHRVDALYSCLETGCKVVLCPDQRQYTYDPAGWLKKKGIEGPICMLRNHVNSDTNKNHGVCEPSGCTKWVLQRGTLGSFVSSEVVQQFMGDFLPSLAVLAIVLPNRLLEYECRGAKVNPKVPTYCGCLDIGGQVLSQRSFGTKTTGGVVCVTGQRRQPTPVLRTW